MAVADQYRILLIGATGLVGEAVLQSASIPIAYVARRAADHGGGHQALLASGDEWPALISEYQPRIFISAIGTTMRQAGSREAFTKVDYDLLITSARSAKAAGAVHFIGVSAVGASATSSNFYLRTKGQAEEAVRAMGFDRTDFLRPGLLTGDRKGPPRFAEGLGNAVSPIMDRILLGGLKKYRSVSDRQMAAAIWRLSGETRSGFFVHQSGDIHQLAD